MCGAGLIARQHAPRDRTARDALPESAPCDCPERALHRAAPLAHEARQRTEPRWQQRLDLGAYAPCEHRGLTCRAHSNEDGRAIDDGGKDEGREAGIIDHVDRYAALLRSL